MKFSISLVVLFACSVAFVGSPGPVSAQKDKDKKKDQPRVILINPVGSVPGRTVKATIRGMKLDKATAVTLSNADTKVKILNKGSAAVPDNNPDQAGNTQVEVEFTLPKTVSEAKWTLIVETPDGKTEPQDFLIEKDLPVIAEKEPNDGFASAQEVTMPQVIDGEIQRNQDVDVFVIRGKKGQRLVIEVFAGRQGSLCDPMLTLYNEKSQQLAFHDDLPGNTDARLEFLVPEDGRYFLTLMDAHDKGGGTHPYRLSLQANLLK